MQQRLVPKNRSNTGFSSALTLLLIVVLIINGLIILRSHDFFHFPGEITKLSMSREGALAIINSISLYANDMGVGDSNVVLDSLARFQYEVGSAKTTEEIAHTVMRNVRLVQEVILREADAMRNQAILSIVSQEPNLPFISGRSSIVLSRESGQELVIADGDGVLSLETVNTLLASKDLQDSFSDIVVEVENGRPRILSQRRLYEQLEHLTSEVARLRSQMVSVEAAAGLRIMSGEGVILRIHDAEGGYTESDIVHDVDVRDILNELFSAGAVGVAVGGQRVINTTSIRCVGSVILVNHHPIPVNPVVIKAIGNPDVLSSSVQIIKNYLEAIKGIRIDVERSDSIELPAYSSSSGLG